MRVQIDKDVDLDTLAGQLKTALGVDVALSARNPGQDDSKGGVLPGVVVLLDAKTGRELPDLDSAKVAAVLAAHTIPTPPKTPARALADALSGAANLADLKAALTAFAGTVADQEDKARQRARGRG